MTTTTDESKQKHFYFKWIPEILIRPKTTFSKVISRSGNVWFTPLFTLSITVIIRVILSGWLKQQAAMLGTITLPPDFQYYTAEQQAQYMQAIQSTQSPVFIYILPAMAALFGLWIIWIITGSLIHLVQTLMGGRTEISTTLTIVAWSSLPFFIKDIVRILYMLSTKSSIQYPGLSGLVPVTEEAVNLILIKFMANIDIYLVWFIVLLIIGIQLATKLTIGKTALGIITTILVILIANSLLAYLLSTLSGLTIIRPFYF
jgi:hypothetical protein